jgi:uncharacterized protein YegP (UPF0339 family)
MWLVSSESEPQSLVKKTQKLYFMNNPKFQLFPSDRNGQYYYRLRSRNGEPILNGEGYTTKQSCLAGIVSVRANAPNDARYQRNDSDGNYTFNLKAANGEIIGRSENYTTRSARDNGIEAVKRDAPDAPIEDLT